MSAARAGRAAACRPACSAYAPPTPPPSPPRPPHRRLPQALQSRNQILEGLNVELQAQLSSKEREVEKLKVALDVAAERSLSSTPSSPRWASCGAGAPPPPPGPQPVVVEPVGAEPVGLEPAGVRLSLPALAQRPAWRCGCTAGYSRRILPGWQPGPAWHCGFQGQALSCCPAHRAAQHALYCYLFLQCEWRPCRCGSARVRGRRLH